MDITFRTLGAWGSGKGTNLLPSEVDNNFWSIAQAVIALQDSPPPPNSISSIAVSGSQMTITLTDGTVQGPFTLPVLVFRWRGEWAPGVPYMVLDVFTVPDTGIFLTQIAHTAPTTFDPNQTDGSGNPVLLQLFGATDMRLEGLSDVQITSVADGDFIHWVDVDQKWENVALGDMAFQTSSAVAITGGTITGMGTPVNPGDVVNKAYVDALPEGMAVADKTLLANISGFTGPALPNTLSDILDYIFNTTVRGSMMYRTDIAWVALAPGTAGYFLQTQGPGEDLIWMPGSAGVTSISAGTGIAASPSPIVASGSIALAAIADANFLANISGSSTAPTPTTLSSFLDHVLTASRGTVITRTAAGWVALSPGVSGQFLKTQGSGADLIWDSPAGSGTVLSVAAGTGLTTGGSPITSTGTMALAAIANLNLLANTSGSSAAPIATTLPTLWDAVFGSTQGNVVYRSGTSWVALAPGTSGQILTTGGTGANPSWQNAPITGSSIANLRIVSNISGSTAIPTGNTLSSIFDAVLSSSRGTLIYRTNSGWTSLAPGTAGQVLTTGGVSSDPHWTAASANAIAGMSDAAITSPADNQILRFVASTAKWTNAGLSALLDSVLSATQGAITYRSATGWVALAPGTSGQALISGGAGANPSWGSSGGLSAISDALIIANISGGSAVPVGNTLSAIIDYVLGSTRGSVIYRGASGWAALTPGSVGQMLRTGGAGTDPAWATPVTTIAGAGDATITSPAANDQLVYVGGAWTNQRPKYNIGCYVPGIPTATQNLLFHRFSKAVTIPANFGSYLGHLSEAAGSAAATASTVITVAKAAAGTPTTFTSVGTITFGAAAVLGTFASTGGTAITFAQGDILRMQAPGTPDTTFADFHATLVGYET